MQIETTLDCGALGEIDVIVHFDYQPREEAVMNPIEDAEPGCAEAADISSIIGSIAGIQLDLRFATLEHDIGTLETECLESVNG